jgi:hypothetical protein
VAFGVSPDRRGIIRTVTAPMRPKTIRQLTDAELDDAIAERSTNVTLHLNDYLAEASRRDNERAAQSAGWIAERTGRTADRALWTAIASASAAVVLAIAAVLALVLGHSEAASPPSTVGVCSSQ